MHFSKQFKEELETLFLKSSNIIKVGRMVQLYVYIFGTSVCVYIYTCRYMHIFRVHFQLTANLTPSFSIFSWKHIPAIISFIDAYISV